MCLNAVEQIAFADRIILNKLDLVTQEQKDAIKARIKVYACALTLGEGSKFLLCSGIMPTHILCATQQLTQPELHIHLLLRCTRLQAIGLGPPRPPLPPTAESPKAAKELACSGAVSHFTASRRLDYPASSSSTPGHIRVTSFI